MVYLRSLATAVACAAFGLAGCGGGGGGGDLVPPPAPKVYTTHILSDPAFDGDIEQTSPTTFIKTQGMSPTVQSVFAGIDPVAHTEFRAFLDFPLIGTGGVPVNAIIDSAVLDVRIKSLQLNSPNLPIRIDLVSLQPPKLIDSDFDSPQPPLAFITVQPPFIAADVGTNVKIDVTPLMKEAQRRSLPDFQVRILEDLPFSYSSLLEIDDTTGVNRPAFAPQLTVTYF